MLEYVHKIINHSFCFMESKCWNLWKGKKTLKVIPFQCFLSLPVNVPLHRAFTHFSQYNTSIHFMKNFCCKTKGQICYFQLAFSCSKTKTNTYTKVFIVLENACDKQTGPLVLSFSSWHINRPKAKGVEFGPTVPAKWIQFAAISNPTIPSENFDTLSTT